MSIRIVATTWLLRLTRILDILVLLNLLLAKLLQLCHHRVLHDLLLLTILDLLLAELLHLRHHGVGINWLLLLDNLYWNNLRLEHGAQTSTQPAHHLINTGKLVHILLLTMRFETNLRAVGAYLFRDLHEHFLGQTSFSQGVLEFNKLNNISFGLVTLSICKDFVIPIQFFHLAEVCLLVGLVQTDYDNTDSKFRGFNYQLFCLCHVVDCTISQNKHYLISLGSLFLISSRIVCKGLKHPRKVSRARQLNVLECLSVHLLYPDDTTNRRISWVSIKSKTVVYFTAVSWTHIHGLSSKPEQRIAFDVIIRFEYRAYGPNSLQVLVSMILKRVQRTRMISNRAI